MDRTPARSGSLPRTSPRWASPECRLRSLPVAHRVISSLTSRARIFRSLNGPNAGTERELTKNLTTLGKPGVQVAVITRRPQGYFITHVEGANFPISEWTERRHGAGAYQEPHHAGQARSAGCGHYPSPTGLFHHSRRGREFSDL